MSIIPCTENCQYQTDGLCMLAQTTETLFHAVPNDRCLNFTPRSDQNSNRLPDSAHSNQFQPFGDD